MDGLRHGGKPKDRDKKYENYISGTIIYAASYFIYYVTSEYLIILLINLL